MFRFAAGSLILAIGFGHPEAAFASACANLSNPPTQGSWKISSQHILPPRFQFQQDPYEGENFGSVSADLSTDIWAVGSGAGAAPTGDSGNGIVYHYDGTQWCPVDDPFARNPGQIVYLEGVAALRMKNVWAVGTVIANSQVLSLIQNWDGTRWTNVPSPNPGYPYYAGGVLQSVSAVSPTDIWAVGYYMDSSANYLALLAHYDGARWTAVTPPTVAGRWQQSSLNAVFARSTNDVWAVGSHGSIGAFGQALVEHFDGRAWSVVPAANLPSGSTDLAGISASAANEAWAVGTGAFAGKSQNATSVIEHWDGTRWGLVQAAPTGSATSRLASVVARSASDVWAAGWTSTGAFIGNGNVASLLQHWDGMAWSVVRSPNSNAPGSTRRPVVSPNTTVGSALLSLAILPAGGLVAVGEYDTAKRVPGGYPVSQPHPWSLMTTLP